MTEDNVTAILAETTRGGRVESVHHGSVAVVDTSGQLLASAGDPDRFLYYRSSAKPFQAIPVIESGAADRFGFTPADLALCCASHDASTRHQEQVGAMLAKLSLSPDALQCGAPLPSDSKAAAEVVVGVTPKSPLQCDCSGKHAGMLASNLQLGYPIEDYLNPTHPLQRHILGLIAEVCDVPVESVALGTDGCSLPTFGLPLRAFARSYAELAQPSIHVEALDRLRAAMMAHPVNVAGEGDLIVTLMTMGGGQIVAKGGAEGLMCFGLPEHGVGVAVRIDDGSYRAHPVICAAVLRTLGLIDASLVDEILTAHDPTIRNHNGWPVGELRATDALQLHA